MRKFSTLVVCAALAACSSATEQPQAATDRIDQPTAQPVETAAATSTVAAPAQTPTPKKPLDELIKDAIQANDAAWAARDASKVSAIYADGAVLMKPDLRGVNDVSAKDNVTKELVDLFKGFPDLKMTHVRVIQARNVVVAEWAVAGTNTAEAWGMKPTNKQVGYAGVSLLLFNDDGKVTREDLYADDPTVMSQMGAPNMKGRPVLALPQSSGAWVKQTGSDEEKTNVEAAKAYYAAFNAKDSKAIKASMTDDVVFVDYGRPSGDVKTSAAVMKDWETFSKAFPDLAFSPKMVLGAGQLVVVEGSFSGTMNGPLGPIKATKKHGTVHFLDVFEMQDGKVARVTSYNNGAELAGAFFPPPAPKEPPAKKK